MRIKDLITKEAYDALDIQADSVKKQQKALKVKAANIRFRKAQQGLQKAQQQKPIP